MVSCAELLSISPAYKTACCCRTHRTPVTFQHSWTHIQNYIKSVNSQNKNKRFLVNKKLYRFSDQVDHVIVTLLLDLIELYKLACEVYQSVPLQRPCRLHCISVVRSWRLAKSGILNEIMLEWKSQKNWNPWRDLCACVHLSTKSFCNDRSNVF